MPSFVQQSAAAAHPHYIASHSRLRFRSKRCCRRDIAMAMLCRTGALERPLQNATLLENCIPLDHLFALLLTSRLHST